MLEENLIYVITGSHMVSSECNYWHVLSNSISSLNKHIIEYIYISISQISQHQVPDISKHFKTQLENTD